MESLEKKILESCHWRPKGRRVQFARCDEMNVHIVRKEYKHSQNSVLVIKFLTICPARVTMRLLLSEATWLALGTGLMCNKHINAYYWWTTMASRSNNNFSPDSSLSNVSFVLVRFHRLLPTHFSAAATTALRLFLWSVNRLVTEQVTALNHSPADNNVLSQRQQRY